MRTRTMILAFSLVLVLACHGLVLGEGCIPKIVGQDLIPADARGVAAQGDYAYVADAKFGLYVFDVSDPTHPTMAGSLKMDNGATRISSINSVYVFLVGGAGHLYIINIYDPAHPRVIATVYLGAKSGWHKPMKTGHYVQLTNSNRAMWIFVDVEDIAHPRVCDASKHLPDSVLGFWNFYADEYAAYLRTWYGAFYGRLKIYDALDLDHIKFRHDVGLPFTGSSVYASGGYVYLDNTSISGPGYPSEFLVYSADPLSQVGAAPMPNCQLNNIQVQGGFAYVSTSMCDDASAGVYIYNVGDPTQPQIKSVIPTPAPIYDLCQSGNYLYLAAGGQGMQVISLNNTAAPGVVASLDLTNKPLALDVKDYLPDQQKRTVGGYHVFLAMQDGALQVAYMDYNSKAMEVVGRVSTPGPAVDVSIDGGYAYVADQGHGLQVVDIKDPNFPSIVGSADTPDNQPKSVYAANGYAYVANGERGLIIYDVSTPSKPRQVGVFETTEAANGVHVVGKYAYVITNDRFHIVDVSTPSAPVSVNYRNSPLGPTNIQFSGGYVYITNCIGMDIWDVRDPETPHLVRRYQALPERSYRSFVLGRHAYMASEDGRLLIIDISNPALPALFKEIASSNAWLGVHAKGPHVYLVGGNAQDSSPAGIMEVVEACLY